MNIIAIIPARKAAILANLWLPFTVFPWSDMWPSAQP
jgi:hypothetical protein